MSTAKLASVAHENVDGLWPYLDLDNALGDAPDGVYATIDGSGSAAWFDFAPASTDEIPDDSVITAARVTVHARANWGAVVGRIEVYDENTNILGGTDSPVTPDGELVTWSHELDVGEAQPWELSLADLRAGDQRRALVLQFDIDVVYLEVEFTPPEGWEPPGGGGDEEPPADIYRKGVFSRSATAAQIADYIVNTPGMGFAANPTRWVSKATQNAVQAHQAAGWGPQRPGTIGQGGNAQRWTHVACALVEAADSPYVKRGAVLVDLVRTYGDGL